MSNEKMRASIKPMLHYVCWEGGKNGSPKILGMDDIRSLMEDVRDGREVMFARKFEENAPALDFIDNEINVSARDC